MNRYYVSPIDNGEEFARVNGRARQRAWLVMDRTTGHDVADVDTRTEARDECRRLNQRNNPEKVSP